MTALAAVRQRQENVANGARKGLRYGGYLVGSWLGPLEGRLEAPWDNSY